MSGPIGLQRQVETRSRGPEGRPQPWALSPVPLPPSGLQPGRRAGQPAHCPPGPFASFYNGRGCRLNRDSVASSTCLHSRLSGIQSKDPSLRPGLMMLLHSTDAHGDLTAVPTGRVVETPRDSEARPPAPGAQPLVPDSPGPPQPRRLTLLTVAPGEARAASPLQCCHRAVGHSVCGSDQSPVTNTRAASG